MTTVATAHDVINRSSILNPNLAWPATRLSRFLSPEAMVKRTNLWVDLEPRNYRESDSDRKSPPHYPSEKNGGAISFL